MRTRYRSQCSGLFRVKMAKMMRARSRAHTHTHTHTHVIIIIIVVIMIVIVIVIIVIVIVIVIEGETDVQTYRRADGSIRPISVPKCWVSEGLTQAES